MGTWVSEFRYAFRALTRQPTFTAIALLTLTLGIGANTAIFSVIKTVLLNPLPYDDPEQVVVLWEVNPEGRLEQVSIPTYRDWRDETTRIEATAAYRQVTYSYLGTTRAMCPVCARRPSCLRCSRPAPAWGERSWRRKPCSDGTTSWC